MKFFLTALVAIFSEAVGRDADEVIENCVRTIEILAALTARPGGRHGPRRSLPAQRADKTNTEGELAAQSPRPRGKVGRHQIVVRSVSSPTSECGLSAAVRSSRLPALAPSRKLGRVERQAVVGIDGTRPLGGTRCPVTRS